MPAAAHLQVPRQHGLFLHHGIDLGDGSVAHYLEGREILRSPLAEFSRGEPVCEVPYPAASCSPVGVTLRRAMGRLGEQNYNLLFNNCEHFAHWCKTGRHRSAQVESWLPAAVFSGARLLLRQNNQLEKGKELTLRSLAQLDQLRLSLQEKLEAELAKAEARWGEERFAALRLAAQRLADQLAEVEELEERLRRQFEPGEDR
ncbi:MAG: lecithin retinol acyltransferase family protein [Cyanobacteria bacterium]|nr:lecithin retinol acyltransferase family protein [Cyanobacteriota bacterium]